MLQSARLRTKEDPKVIIDALRVNPKEAVILVRIMRVLDEIHLFRATQSMLNQPELVAVAVEIGAHRIHRRQMREVRREKRRHLQISVTVLENWRLFVPVVICEIE